MKKHAITAGLGAPARLRSADLSHLAAGPASMTQKETAGALQSTTVAIKNQHSDFASLEQSTPVITHPIKSKLMHVAAWLALVLGGVA